MLSLINVRMAYGGPALLDGASLEIRAGEKLALLGRNGSGKTTLFKILTGALQPDAGERVLQGAVRIAELPQSIPEAGDQTVEAVLRERLADLALEDWEVEARLDAGMRQLGPAGERIYSELSWGQKRQVLLLGSLLRQPDLLLLDEPTNHLDVASIRWMEAVLGEFKGALIFISHDRTFVRKLAHGIIDLDRGKVTRWDCGLDRYMERKAEELAAEEKQKAVFDKKLAEEEAWIRQGIQARRTRNEGRVRQLQKMREEHRQRRGRTGRVAVDSIGGAERSGHKVISAEGITAAPGGQPLFQPFSCEILRGDRVGILGPNGCGKSTLIRLLLGQEEPASGTVELGTRLQIAYFDQNREQLDEDRAVKDNVAEGNEFVDIGGKRRHVISHLKDFLFTSEQARGPIRNLSGGERNRLLLARLFCRPFNLLVMDEPTNDLDLETLELLEEQLAQFQGTLLLVSHDRAFLDNVVTELLVFENDGVIRPIVGGYADYRAFRERTEQRGSGERSRESEKGAASGKRGRPEKPRRFLNRERRELEELPPEIEQLEKEQEGIAAELADPEMLKAEPRLAVEGQKRLEAIEEELAAKYGRWEELENLRTELEG